MRAIDLEDDWLNWEEEDKQPKHRGRGDKRMKDKERTLQRKKQRQRKVIYSSNDEELPVYGYEEDWE